MPSQCVAAGCNNSSSLEATMYRFPTDPLLKKEWIAQVQRTRAQWKGLQPTSVLHSAVLTLPVMILSLVVHLVNHLDYKTS